MSGPDANRGVMILERPSIAEIERAVHYHISLGWRLAGPVQRHDYHREGHPRVVYLATLVDPKAAP